LVHDFGARDRELRRIESHSTRAGHVQVRVDDFLEVGARQSGDYARLLPCRREIDVFDASMGVRAADDCHVQHRGQRKVVDVATPPADKAWVLTAVDASADEPGDGHERSG
jgi:hypothetical protein